eukprot:TRINITY_DN1469_c0_g1_i4.p1 TRINITY_DN1469_c0_g1~~TRINITY_DN1469_c0_g1_i4.p1  ORF type:complete len:474 (-),score=128.89 TRINITY_DN1469_c0_g1_i4:160-1581(-)
MTIDILLTREDQGGNLEMVKASQAKRFKDPAQVDTLVELDKQSRHAAYELTELQRIVKQSQTQITEKFKKKETEGVDELKQQKEDAEKKIPAQKELCEKLAKQVDVALRPIGNIVHDSVIVSKDEANNEIVAQWGEFVQKPKHHHELLYMIDGADLPRGVEVAGHRAYFLRGWGVKLNLALIQYGIDFLQDKNGYTALQTPFMMDREPMSHTAQLEQFDEELYKVTGEANDEKYLIATSEQPISAYHMNEWIEEKTLPLKYAGFSTCFRKEAGSHGRDTWGIFRVHQFEKVEQFCITTPEKSWEMHEEMMNISKSFYQSLGIPYRVVNIVSGELNNAAAKKYDLEGWFPGFNEYRELVSASNCTDYQSRSLEIRCGSKKQGDKVKRYVHMLNATLCATTRTICAILENHQTPDGIQIPTVLQPYMGGKTLIPYVNLGEMPKGKGAKGKPEETRKPSDVKAEKTEKKTDNQEKK